MKKLQEELIDMKLQIQLITLAIVVLTAIAIIKELGL